jgi:hypothetical protein
MSQITIASICEKPPFFNQYTPWVATAKFVTKSGQEPTFGENEADLLLGLAENELTIIEKSLQTSGSAYIY